MSSIKHWAGLAFVLIVLLWPPGRLYGHEQEPAPPPVKIHFETTIISFSAAALQKNNVPIPKDGAFVKADELNQLIRGIQDIPQATAMHLPALTVATGRKDSLMCLQQQAYVSGWSERKANGKRQAQISTAQTGVSVELLPLASTEGNFVVLFMHPRVSALLSLNEVPWDQAPAENLKIQKADMAVLEANTIAWIPDGATLVLHLRGEPEQIQKMHKQSATPADTLCLVFVRPVILAGGQNQQQQLPVPPVKPQ